MEPIGKHGIPHGIPCFFAFYSIIFNRMVNRMPADFFYNYHYGTGGIGWIYYG
jgi:hypothetical protein